MYLNEFAFIVNAQLHFQSWFWLIIGAVITVARTLRLSLLQGSLVLEKHDSFCFTVKICMKICPFLLTPCRLSSSCMIFFLKILNEATKKCFWR